MDQIPCIKCDDEIHGKAYVVTKKVRVHFIGGKGPLSMRLWPWIKVKVYLCPMCYDEEYPHGQNYTTGQWAILIATIALIAVTVVFTLFDKAHMR